MNKRILYIVVVLLIVINVLLTYKSLTHESLKEPNNTAETLLSLNRSYYSSNVINSQFNNNVTLSKDLALTDLNSKPVDIHGLVNSGTRLIVRSTEDGCGLCIETELEIVKRYSNLIGGKNIAVITTHSNVRKLQVFKQTNNIPFEMYICNDLGLPFERTTSKPFIFTLDQNLVAQNFFIPEVTENKISEDYYTAIYQRYYKQKVTLANLSK